MLDDNLVRKLVNETHKMPLREMIEKKQKIINRCQYYLNNLNSVRPEQTTYRIESFSCFLNNIENSRLYFAWPGKWEDIFDGAFVRTPIYFEKGDILVACPCF
jgi:hypothetical protein